MFKIITAVSFMLYMVFFRFDLEVDDLIKEFSFSIVYWGHVFISIWGIVAVRFVYEFFDENLDWFSAKYRKADWDHATHGINPAFTLIISILFVLLIIVFGRFIKSYIA